MFNSQKLIEVEIYARVKHFQLKLIITIKNSWPPKWATKIGLNFFCTAKHTSLFRQSVKLKPPQKSKQRWPQVSLIFISTLSGHKVLKVPILLLLDLSKHLANPHSGKVRRLQSIKKQVVAVAASTSSQSHKNSFFLRRWRGGQIS